MDADVDFILIAISEQTDGVKRQKNQTDERSAEWDQGKMTNISCR